MTVLGECTRAHFEAVCMKMADFLFRKSLYTFSLIILTGHGS